VGWGKILVRVFCLYLHVISFDLIPGSVHLQRELFWPGVCKHPSKHPQSPYVQMSNVHKILNPSLHCTFMTETKIAEKLFPVLETRIQFKNLNYLRIFDLYFSSHILSPDMFFVTVDLSEDRNKFEIYIELLLFSALKYFQK